MRLELTGSVDRSDVCGSMNVVADSAILRGAGITGIGSTQMSGATTVSPNTNFEQKNPV